MVPSTWAIREVSKGCGVAARDGEYTDLKREAWSVSRALPEQDRDINTETMRDWSLTPLQAAVQLSLEAQRYFSLLGSLSASHNKTSPLSFFECPT